MLAKKISQPGEPAVVKTTGGLALKKEMPCFDRAAYASSGASCRSTLQKLMSSHVEVPAVAKTYSMLSLGGRQEAKSTERHAVAKAFMLEHHQQGPDTN